MQPRYTRTASLHRGGAGPNFPPQYVNHGTNVDPKLISSSDTCGTNPDLISIQPSVFPTTRSDQKSVQPSAFPTTRGDPKPTQQYAFHSTKSGLKSTQQSAFQSTRSDPKPTQQSAFQSTRNIPKQSAFQSTRSDLKSTQPSTFPDPKSTQQPTFPTTRSDPKSTQHSAFQSTRSDPKPTLQSAFQSTRSDLKSTQPSTFPDPKFTQQSAFPTTTSYPKPIQQSAFPSTRSGLKPIQQSAFQSTRSDPTPTQQSAFQSTRNNPKQSAFQSTRSDLKFTQPSTFPDPKSTQQPAFLTTRSDPKPIQQSAFQSTRSDPTPTQRSAFQSTRNDLKSTQPFGFPDPKSTQQSAFPTKRSDPKSTQQSAFQSTRSDLKSTQPFGFPDSKSTQQSAFPTTWNDSKSTQSSMHTTSTALIIKQQSQSNTYISKHTQQNGKDNLPECTCPQATPQLSLQKICKDLAGSQYTGLCGTNDSSSPSPPMSNIQQLRGISVGHIAAKSFAAAAAGSSLLCTERNAPQWDQHITSPRGQHESSTPIRQQEQRKSKPHGIPNFGNTCYINATVQSLLSVMNVRSYFLSRSDTGEASTIVKAFSQLLKKLLTNNEISDSCKVEICCLSSFFPKYSQQDAQEFLMFLLDDIFQWCSQMEEKVETSFYGLFRGDLTYEIHCSMCKEAKDRVDPFVFLSVPLPNKKRSSLKECVISMMEKTYIEGKWNCSNCSNLVVAQRQVSVSKFPTILVVHLKRFYMEGNLDLSVVSKPPILAPKYSLIAVINHYGTSSGGHYVAYCKRENGWYSFDDSTVSSITETEIVTPVAYVLFYEKKERNDLACAIPILDTDQLT